MTLTFVTAKCQEWNGWNIKAEVEARSRDLFYIQSIIRTPYPRYPYDTPYTYTYPLTKEYSVVRDTIIIYLLLILRLDLYWIDPSLKAGDGYVAKVNFRVYRTYIASCPEDDYCIELVEYSRWWRNLVVNCDWLSQTWIFRARHFTRYDTCTYYCVLHTLRSLPIIVPTKHACTLLVYGLWANNWHEHDIAGSRDESPNSLY